MLEGTLDKRQIDITRLAEDFYKFSRKYQYVIFKGIQRKGLQYAIMNTGYGKHAGNL